MIGKWERALSLWKGWNALLSYTSALAVMSWEDGEEPAVDVVASQHKENLSASLWTCISAMEKLPWEVQQLKENISSSPLVWTSISAIRSKDSSVHWFCLQDQRENMRKWDEKIYLDTISTGKWVARKNSSKSRVLPVKLLLQFPAGSSPEEKGWYFFHS